MAGNVHVLIVASFLPQAQPLIQMLASNPAAFCNLTNFESYLAVPENSSVNLTQIQMDLCQLNLEDLQRENFAILARLGLSSVIDVSVSCNTVVPLVRMLS